MAYNWKRLSQLWIQMLDLNDIVVFARVVEAGSFTAAARLLGMPKTTVSRRIAALEREVGVRLVQRTTRSLNMTDAGRLYYEQSSQALRTIEDANLLLAEARAEPSGTIRISAPVGFGGHFLTSAVFDFVGAAILLFLMKLVVHNKKLYEEPDTGRPPPLIRGTLILTCTLVSFFHGSND